MKADINKKSFKSALAIGVVLVFASINMVFADDDLFVKNFFDPVFKETEKHLIVNIHKKDAEYSVRSLEVVAAASSYMEDFEMYKGKSYNGVVKSFRGATLGYFGANSMVIIMCSDSFGADGKISGGCKELSEGDLHLVIPYFPNGKYADIYNPEGKKILTIDLSSKATCNENERCDQPLEDSINCPSDCRANEPVIMEPAEQQSPQSDREEKAGWWDAWGKLALASATVLIIGIGVVIARQNKRRY